MKKTLLVSVLVVALTFAFAAAAFAEHAPSNYATWNATLAGTDNPLTAPTPHSGYTQNTYKCNVCHAVHRAAVIGSTQRNQVGGAWVVADTDGDTELLLRSSVANACTYCHITTAVGAVRLFNGNTANRGGTPGAFTSGWGHESMVCEECHSVHSAESFKGAAASKILKWTPDQHLRDSATFPHYGYTRAAIPNIGTNVADHTFDDPITGESHLVGMQDEIFVAPNGVTVASGNVPQFGNIEDVIAGVNPINDAVGADMKDLQVGAFCTLCHQTYASASESIVNLDQDQILIGGTYGVWTLSNGPKGSTIAGTYMTKGHPVMKATTNFIASGSEESNMHEVVAWGDANTCRKCHDAGSSDAPDGAVVYNSWPHMTPGYYRFLSAADSAAEYTTFSALVGTPWTTGGPGVVPARRSAFSGAAWLPVGAFVNLADTGDPDAQSIASQFPDMMIKGTLTNPNSSVTIGRDGACLKCHRASATQGIGMTF